MELFGFLTIYVGTVVVNDVRLRILVFDLVCYLPMRKSLIPSKATRNAGAVLATALDNPLVLPP